MARRKTIEEEQLTDTTYYILLALMQPIHGYGIMQKVAEISEGMFEIGPASLYTSLKKLKDAEMIELYDETDDRKKTYSITCMGKSLLKKEFDRRRQMVEHGAAIIERGVFCEQDSKKDD